MGYFQKQDSNQINTYVCLQSLNVWMILETTYCSKTKQEHGTDYLDLAFSANKMEKELIFSFKVVKRLNGLIIKKYLIVYWITIENSHYLSG